MSQQVTTSQGCLRLSSADGNQQAARVRRLRLPWRACRQELAGRNLSVYPLDSPHQQQLASINVGLTPFKDMALGLSILSLPSWKWTGFGRTCSRTRSFNQLFGSLSPFRPRLLQHPPSPVPATTAAGKLGSESLPSAPISLIPTTSIICKAASGSLSCSRQPSCPRKAL